MRPFKFLSNKKPIFPYEMVGEIRWFPATLMGYESYTREKSDLIRGWLSECWYDTEYLFNRVKYFHEIDRTCVIIQRGLDTHGHQQVFAVTVQIQRSNDCYMEIDLKYPI